MRQDLQNGEGLDVGSISELINLGSGFGENPEHFISWLPSIARDFGFYPHHGKSVSKSAVHLMKSISDFADRRCPVPNILISANVCSGCNCNGLHFAVLERSVSKVERYLKCHPKMVSAQNLFGQTPLHLAADWPWACEALLAAEADISTADFDGNLPLSYACFQGCFETVQILIAANSPLSSSCYAPSVLDRAILDVDNERIHVTLINELAARRHKLLTSSQVLLPRHFCEGLTRGLKSLPDLDSISLIERLSDAGDRTDPNHWSYTYQSVYELEAITVEIAERLFVAGFTDLEGQDPVGYTVLLRTAMRTSLQSELVFAKIGWLLSKGVSLRRLVEVRPLSRWLIPSVNVVSAMLGQVISKYNVVIQDYHRKSHVHGSAINDLIHERLGNSTKEVLGQVLSSQYQKCHDSCECHCSLHGCTPMVMFLKGLKSSNWRNFSIEEQHELSGLLIDWILKILAHGLTASEKVELTNSALRFCLFEDLGLRHTCCRPIHWCQGQGLLPPIESEEAHEIREEDEWSEKILHDLLPKAESEYHRASNSFSDFWPIFYRETIVTKLNEDVVENHIDGIEVKLHQVDQKEGGPESEKSLQLGVLKRQDALWEEMRRLNLLVLRR